MSQCNQCGKHADELWAVPGEYGKTEFICDGCIPKPCRCDVTGERHLRCPVCNSIEYREVSEEYWFSRIGGLFLCKRNHLFTVRKVAQEVNVRDGLCPNEPQRLDVTGEERLRCPLCLSAQNRKVTRHCRFYHSKQLFKCKHGHLFELRTVTEQVWIADD